MKITKPGRPMAGYEFSTTCTRCGCEFSFNEGEEGVSALREGPRTFYLAAACPNDGCGNHILVTRPKPGGAT